MELDDEAAARAAVEAEEVDGALLTTGPAPELLLQDRDSTMEAVVGAAVSGVAVAEQLAEAGVDLAAVPELQVTPLSGRTTPTRSRSSWRSSASSCSRDC